MYSAVLYLDSTKCCKTYWTAHHSANDPKLQKQPKSFPCQRNGIFFNGDGRHMISIQQKAFKLLNINLNVETHNQEASEGDCSKALAEHLEGEYIAYHDGHGF